MKKIRLLTLMLIASSFTGLVSSCGTSISPDAPIEEPVKHEIKLTKDDAITLNEVLPSTFKLDENTKVASSNSKIARVIGQKVFAIKEGKTTITVANEDSNYEFDVEVTSYETYEDVEVFTRYSSYGGYLIDAVVGSAFIKGRSYDFLFSPTNATNGDKDFSVVISDPDIIEFNDNDGLYSFTCKKVGNAVMKFINADGFTNAVFVIKVRAGYENKDEYVFALQKYDYWGGYGFFDGYYQQDSTKITFVDDSTGIFAGKDGAASFEPISFNYSVMEEEDTDAFSVLLKVTNFQNPQQTFDLTYIRFFKAGDQLMTYAGEGESTRLNELYYPKMNK